MIDRFKSFIEENPSVIFVFKGLLIYVLWFIIYDLIVLPDGRVDEALSIIIIEVSATVLRTFGLEVYSFYRVLGIENTIGIEVVNGCNGLSAIGLFLGFIFAYPGDNIKRWLFAITGMSVIYLTNIVRIVVLALIQYYYPSIFDFTHDYSTTTIFYIIIFILWVIWANYGGTTTTNNLRKVGAE